MLTITIPGRTLYDEEKDLFLDPEPSCVLELEHSLVSLSKWESIFRKPFLGEEEKSPLEIYAYIECMILNQVYPDNILNRLSHDNLEAIKAYIESAESATTFGELPERKGKKERITSELIYYWLVAFQIPFEVERWHLNRLFSLIRICNIKNQKPDKKSKQELARQYREENAKRRAQFNTTG